MATYQVDIEKFLNGEYWTNRYYVVEASLLAALAPAQAIVSGELTFHLEVVLTTKYRVSTLAENDNQYVSRPVNQFGQLPVGSGILPLFNTLRIDWEAGLGRPYRKYYRGVLDENTINGSIVGNATLNAKLDTFLVEMDGIIFDNTGTALGPGSVYPRIQMRQLRRGSRRRSTPILPS